MTKTKLVFETKKTDTNENLLNLELEIYEVDSTTVLETMGASVSWNSCSAIVRTVG